MDLSQFTARSAVDALKKGETTPRDLIQASLKLIEDDNRREDKLNAVIYIDEQKAIKDAEEVTRASLLAGLPIMVKDNMNVSGQPLQCASRIINGYISPYSGTAVEYAVKNGAVILGRTNMDEFAMGSSTETSAHGLCPKSTESGLYPRRLFRGSGRGGGKQSNPCRPWFGYGRVNSSTSFRLWGGWIKTDLRAGLTPWVGCLWIISGSNRPACEDRRRCGFDVTSHRRP